MPTDWKRLEKMEDKDIDTSDIPELDDDFFKNAEPLLPSEKQVEKHHKPAEMRSSDGMPLDFPVWLIPAVSSEEASETKSSATSVWVRFTRKISRLFSTK